MHRLALLLPILSLSLAGAAPAQFFLPPGVLNPDADVDFNDDLFAYHVITPDGTVHAVWVSQVDHTHDSSTDRDLFYRQLPPGGTWSTPELVNTYGRVDDNSDEGNPKIAVDASGGVHCVWQSQYGLDGAGPDWEVFYAYRTPGTPGATNLWQSTEHVNGASNDDPLNLPSDDVNPAIAIVGNGDVLITWESNRAHLPGPSDLDLVYRTRDSSGWLQFGTVNHNAYTDSGDDLGPAAMATLASGDVVAVWSTDDDFQPPPFQVGGDRDIVWSRFDPINGWSSMLEINELARFDSGDDRNPSIAVWGSGFEEELHVVWQSTEDYESAGTDLDLLYTLVGVNAVVLPAINPTYVVNRWASQDNAANDERPSICVEPGGALHVVWESTVDPPSLPSSIGTDRDVLHAVNGTPGPEWSRHGLLGLNAFIDGATSLDERAQLQCAGNGLLSAMWASRDASFGLGADYDAFHAIGFGVGATRPRTVAPWGRFDAIANDDFALAFAVDGQDRLHAVWSSWQSGSGAPQSGSDIDILYSVLGPSGWSAVELVNTTGAADSGHDFEPDVAVDSAGAVHVVWSSTEDIGGAVGSDRDIFYAERPPGGSFSAPVRVHDSATFDNAVPNDDANPRIVVSPLGVVHVAWVSQQQLFAPFSGKISYASKPAGASWSLEQIASGADFGAAYHSDPDLALVGETPILVWESTSDVGGIDTDRDILFNERGLLGWPAVGWLGNSSLDVGDDFQPSVAVEPSGTVHVVWSTAQPPAFGGDFDLVHTSRSGGAWTPLRQLLTYAGGDKGDDSSPHIATDGNALHVIWNSNDQLTLDVAGSDWDVFYARVPLPLTGPSPSVVGVADASAFGDFTREWARSIVLDSDGRPWFGWDRDGAFDSQFGPDTDVLYGRPVVVAGAAGIFADGFESGNPSAWSAVEP